MSAKGQVGGPSASKFYPDSSERAQSRLRSAADHVRAGQWSEAIDIYQRLIDEFGDKVAKLPREQVQGEASKNDEFVLYVDLRDYCRRSLATLPFEARAIYRSRIDADAERWYRQGLEGRDEVALRLVVERAFCSSWGDEALETLGDLAFQDGRFSEALARYRTLVADRPDDRLSLVHPDPSVDLALVAAKKLLVRAAAGEHLDVKSELTSFSKRFPEAKGSLAGRKGALASILEQSLVTDQLSPPKQPDGRWPTFAGSPTRSRVVAEPVDVGSLQWRVPLERINPRGNPYGYSPRPMATGQPTGPPKETLLGYHPIILGDQVIVCDSTRVLAFNLNDRPGGPEGSSALGIDAAWKHDPESGSVPQVARVMGTIPRYTLTASGTRIFARMGSSNVPSFMSGRNGAGTGGSYILALDWSSGGKFLWMAKSSELVLPNRPADRVNRSVTFEGTPVADARSVFAAVTDRREQTATYVVCLDASSGSVRWMRYLGAASSEVDNFMAMGMGFGNSLPGDYGHRLLSLDGSILYYQTNLGAVVAIDSETGSIRWVATYPRQDVSRTGAGSERDLNPAIVHEGLVIVAPSDASSIYAFDSSSGRLAWKTDPIPEEVKLSHLLGVAKGRLVVTGDRVLLFDVKNGALLHTWPDSGKSMEGYGRGLLAGDSIYWPTRNEIQVLDQRSGTRGGPPIRLMEAYRTSGGNLVAGDGYLIVSQSDALVVFCQNSRLIERFKQELVLNPNSAATHFRLARAAEAVGRDDVALDAYEKTAQIARGSETVDGIPLLEAAQEHQFRVLIRLAETARRSKRLDVTLKALERAAAIARTDRDRLQAMLQKSDVLIESSRPTDAIDVVQNLLGDDRNRALTINSDDGHRSVRVDLFLADRLSNIVGNAGRKVYEAYDRRAREFYERGIKERDPRLFEEVARTFPIAEVVPDALLALGQASEAAGRPASAVRAYKRLLALPTVGDDSKAQALWNLAHSYEAQKQFSLARERYLQLLERYPRLTVEVIAKRGEPSQPSKSAQIVSERIPVELARSPLIQVSGDRLRPQVPIPLSRRWHCEAGAAGRVNTLAARGELPTSESSRYFLVRGTHIEPIDPSTGGRRWSTDLEAPAVWVGYSSDRLLAATQQAIVSLDAASGAIQWRYGRGASREPRRNLDPFTREAPGSQTSGDHSFPLHDHQLGGGHLFFLRGDSELIALDCESGLVEWSFSTRSGVLNPRLWIGTDRIVVQSNKPSQLMVLDSETGRLVGRTTMGESEILEREPVAIDDDHLAIVSDRRTVKNFDLRRCQFLWEYRESTEMPVNGPPRILVTAERLLVLHEGRHLIRLDPSTGARRWSTVLGTEDLSERPESIACDDRRFYCVSRQRLHALSLEDGAVRWSCHLTGPENVHWALTLADQCVVAYPRLSNLSDDEVENMPVVVRRQETGSLVQRFVFPAMISDVRLRLDARGALVSTPHGLWSLGRRPGLATVGLTPESRP